MRGTSRSLALVVQYSLLLIAITVAVLPLGWAIITAFKPDEQIVAYPPTGLPNPPTLHNYVQLFGDLHFGVYLGNSMVVSVFATVATLLIGTIGAYSLARFERRYMYLRVLGGLSLAAYMVPSILLVVPIVQIVAWLGLENSLTALVVVYTASLAPFVLWILRSYFHGISIELEEAAMVDGCTRFGAFWRVVLPQAASGIIATGVFAFSVAWSEYLYASVILVDPSNYTLSIGMNYLLSGQQTFSWGALMAGTVIVTIPVVILFTIAHRHVVGGVGQGAVTG